jgi:hypothetical protein
LLLKSKNEQEDAKKEEEGAKREEEDQKFNDQVIMMQAKNEKLEAERDTLTKQCESDSTTIARIKKGNKLKRFDDNFEDKANDFKYEETRARLIDLEAE